MEVSGLTLNSRPTLFSESYSSCMMRLVSDDSHYTSKRLMLKFEQFDISDCGVQLKIIGTSGSDVCLFCIILFIWFKLIKQLMF